MITGLCIYINRCGTRAKEFSKILKALGLKVVATEGGCLYQYVYIDNPHEEVMDKIARYYAYQEISQWKTLRCEISLYDKDFKHIKVIGNVRIGYPI